jgi:hypothetical protein
MIPSYNTHLNPNPIPTAPSCPATPHLAASILDVGCGSGVLALGPVDPNPNPRPPLSPPSLSPPFLTSAGAALWPQLHAAALDTDPQVPALSLLSPQCHRQALGAVERNTDANEQIVGDRVKVYL